MTKVITARSEPISQFLNPADLIRHLWHHRELIRQFTQREIESRYRGSFLGIIWSFVNPLTLLLIYTFVFGIVLQARWPEARTESLSEFAMILFCGLVAFNIFSECVGRAPAIIINVPNYVKKVVFPLEILPISVLGAALFNALISLSILIVANLFVSQTIAWTLIFVPLVFLPLILLCLGLSWFLASLGVFIRDVSYTVSLIVQVLFFLTPIFYSIEFVPEPFRTIINLNPLTAILENIRRVVLWNELPYWGSLTFAIISSLVVMVLGYAWFMKTKKAFADVI
ncbi:MAG: ABC-type polysaccharide/polyol phosphate export permease [Chloroflexi bacterium AL-W]|nr:ABC-type polysaccharide/polyol phosphate export permease [Chloroflexi bacterium AL-N1]NOK68933.1 ABC-type polysaccharide/polyol phosphate export permease [Chloroflexi bacterium AL-N10]NOK76916.1 ABC-type polysaccharide/polyol phosphate export permease [Chloroflexi bacterium AL-N5]NOK82696.1 ABC-type polysaccharide/polyol phosphate export permease [Chloroflexi bacterium AL-W]NOK90773.1 ABC-type polysaccharide/polyol phosphate export permease [Chloroflexi bacterium AL-N15]